MRSINCGEIPVITGSSCSVYILLRNLFFLYRKTMHFLGEKKNHGKKHFIWVKITQQGQLVDGPKCCKLVGIGECPNFKTFSPLDPIISILQNDFWEWTFSPWSNKDWKCRRADTINTFLKRSKMESICASWTTSSSSSSYNYYFSCANGLLFLLRKRNVSFENCCCCCSGAAMILFLGKLQHYSKMFVLQLPECQCTVHTGCQLIPTVTGHIRDQHRLGRPLLRRRGWHLLPPRLRHTRAHQPVHQQRPELFSYLQLLPKILTCTSNTSKKSNTIPTTRRPLDRVPISPPRQRSNTWVKSQRTTSSWRSPTMTCWTLKSQIHQRIRPVTYWTITIVKNILAIQPIVIVLPQLPNPQPRRTTPTILPTHRFLTSHWCHPLTLQPARTTTVPMGQPTCQTPQRQLVPMQGYLFQTHLRLLHRQMLLQRKVPKAKTDQTQVSFANTLFAQHILYTL